MLRCGIKRWGSWFVMLNKFVALTILGSTQIPSLSAEQIQFIEGPTIYISETNGLKVNQDAHTTFESFVRNWSQFEILIDKNLFPIKAPNCKQTIQLRFKGIEPIKNETNQVQKSRWELLERLRTNNIEDTTPVFHYINRSANGKYTLEYCNVFVE